MKKTLFALVAFALLAACSQQAKWTGDPQLVYKLTSKMPAAEVKKLLGEPSRITEMPLPGVKTESWVYNGSQKLLLIVQGDKLVHAEIDSKTVVDTPVNEL